MKNIFLCFLFAVLASALAAQAPQAINYQAIARDKSGSPIANQPIGVQFRVLQGGADGRAAYTETYATTTNQLGLFNLQIGRGTAVSGTFADVDWGSSSCFLEVAIDPVGGTDYQVLGTSEMLSVPYALNAGNVKSAKQVLSMEGNQLSISEGNKVELPLNACDVLEDCSDGVSPNDTKVIVYDNVSNPFTDEIHMDLGKDRDLVAKPDVLVLRKNNNILALPINPNPNVMLEIFDPSGGDNLFVGRIAGEYNTYVPSIGVNQAEGDLNTAFGSGAFQFNTKGRRNTAVGQAALNHNSLGSANTAVGQDALLSNTSGDGNTAVGVSSLVSNFTGNANTAIGRGTLATNNSGNNNTATGAEALNSNGTGNGNTANGVIALSFNTSGGNNTAVGISALHYNQTGEGNTAIGANTFEGATGTKYDYNTAVGAEALRVNTGNSNVANGAYAMFANTTGGGNSALGRNALFTNSTGSNNTAVGSGSDVAANNLTNASAIGANAKVTGSNSMILGDNINVGIGLSNLPAPTNRLEINAASPNASGLTFRQLNANYVAPPDPSATPEVLTVDLNGVVVLRTLTGVGGGGTDWHITGNTGIVSTDFLGTINNAPLNFKVNNTAAGKITPNGPVFLGYQAGSANNNATALTNTAVGFRALATNTIGTLNTAMGANALANNTGNLAIRNTAVGASALSVNISGARSTAVGASALRLNTANDNTATGSNALEMNNVGVENTANGGFALSKNLTGNYNTACGKSALQDNLSGSNNTSTGYTSLLVNNTGSFNTATGAKALFFNTAASFNTATGFQALQFNTTAAGLNGENNTANGANSLRNSTTGHSNTAVGVNALTTNTTGNCNTALGKDANVSTASLTNATAIGCSAIANASNKMQLGNTITNVISTQGGYTIMSDARFKSNVRADAPGLDFILRLHPVTYNFSYAKLSEFLGEKNMDQKALHEKENKREMGLIAQEVEKVCQETGNHVSNLIYAPENEHDNYSIAYGQLVVPLTKAIQEQQAQIEALQLQNAQLGTLTQQNQSLQTQLDALRAEMQSFRAAIGQLSATQQGKGKE